MVSAASQGVAVDPRQGRDGDGVIGAKLRAVWRRQRMATHAQGACLVVLWAAGLLVADLLIDWLFLLPGYARLLLLLVNLATLGWIAWTRWISKLQPYDPVRVALQVERDNPQLQSLVVSYVQLDDATASASPYVSPALIAAMRRQAVELTGPIDFTRVVDLRELRRLAIVCVACVLIFGALSVNWSNVLRTLLIRLINPTATLAYPTRTRIDSLSGDLTVRQGDPVAITAAISGLVPVSADLLVRPEGTRRWDRVGLALDDDRSFSHPIDRATDSFEYQLKVGDAQSPVHTVTVVPPPALTASSIRVAPPAYTGLPPREVESFNLEVPQASDVTWTLTVDRPLRAAALHVAGGEPVALDLDPAGIVATVTLTPDAALTYEFHFTDRAYGYAYADGVRYTLRVVPDQPPQVTLIQPDQDGLGVREIRLPVAFQTGDDFGLRDATLIYLRNEGEESRLPLGPLTGTSHTGQFTWTPVEQFPDLSVGDTVAFAVEVRDNREGQDQPPNVGRSAFRRYTLVSAAEYEAHIAARQEELRNMLRNLRDEEETAGNTVDDLLKRTP